MKKQDNAIIGIYKITSPSSKIYIGQSINVKNRENNYIKYNKHMSSQYKLYNSLQKHGWEQHKFEIIEECDIKSLNEREVYWKQYYLKQVENDWSKILFCNIYDTGGGPKSEETRNKISKGLLGSKNMLGKKHTEETKKLMSEKSKGKPKSESHKNNMRKSRSEQAKLNISKGKKGKTSPMKGKTRSYKGRISPNKGNKHSEEVKNKIGEKLKGNLNSAHPIKHTGTGHIWRSKTECATHYGVSNPTISNWIKNNKNSLILY